MRIKNHPKNDQVIGSVVSVGTVSADEVGNLE